MMPPLPQSVCLQLGQREEALLSNQAVISEPANTLQEMIVVNQGNDIDSPLLLQLSPLYIHSGSLLLLLAAGITH